MPRQRITLEIETKAIPEEERAEFEAELLRATNALLAPYLESRDSLQGSVTRWEAK